MFLRIKVYNEFDGTCYEILYSNFSNNMHKNEIKKLIHARIINDIINISSENYIRQNGLNYENIISEMDESFSEITVYNPEKRIPACLHTGTTHCYNI